jgi:hypothetical protein
MGQGQSLPAHPLGTLAGSVGLRAIALVFSGWTYRWHYYTFFQVDPTHLGFSVESTSIAAFALLFRSPLALASTLGALAVALAGILLTFQAIRASRGWRLACGGGGGAAGLIQPCRSPAVNGINFASLAPCSRS